MNSIKKKRLIKAGISSTLGLTSFALAWVWFGWELALILFIAEFGMNIGNSLKYMGSNK